MLEIPSLGQDAVKATVLRQLGQLKFLRHLAHILILLVSIISGAVHANSIYSIKESKIASSRLALDDAGNLTVTGAVATGLGTIGRPAIGQHSVLYKLNASKVLMRVDCVSSAGAEVVGNLYLAGNLISSSSLLKQSQDQWRVYGTNGLVAKLDGVGNLYIKGQLTAPACRLIGVARTSRRVDLDWRGGMTSLSGYHLYRSDNGAPFTLLASLAADQTRYVDKSATAGRGYRYQVAPIFAGGGESTFSNIVSVMTLDASYNYETWDAVSTPHLPGAMYNANASGSVSGSDHSWSWHTLSSDVTNCGFRSSWNGWEAGRFAAGTDGGDFMLEGIAAPFAFNTTNSLQIGFEAKLDTVGSDGQRSIAFEIRDGVSAEDGSVVIRLNAQTSQPALTIQAMSGGTVSNVISAPLSLTDANEYWIATQLDATSNGLLVNYQLYSKDALTTPLASGTGLLNCMPAVALNQTSTTFQRRAVGSIDDIELTRIVRIGVPEVQSDTSSQLTISWNAVNTPVSYYKLWRANAASGPYSVVTTTTLLSLSDGNLAANTHYFYKVSAVKPNSGESVLSPSGSNWTRPNVPVLTATAASENIINVSWSISGGADSVKLYQKSELDADWINIHTGSEASHQATNLISSTLYSYYVVAINNGGDSPNSAMATVATNPSQIRFTSSTIAVNEAGGPINIGVMLTNPSKNPISVQVQQISGTANANDLTFTASLQFTAMSTTPTLPLCVNINNDSLNEANETAVLQLHNATSATLSSEITHTLTIIDDDIAPTVSFDQSGSEGLENAGITQAAVHLSNPSGQEIRVDYDFAGDATAGADYVGTTGTLVFVPGALTPQNPIQFSLIDDMLNEADETIEIRLHSNPALAGNGSKMNYEFKILDNDPRSLFMDDSAEIETGSLFRPKLLVDQPIGRNETLSYSWTLQQDRTMGTLSDEATSAPLYTDLSTTEGTTKLLVTVHGGNNAKDSTKSLTLHIIPNVFNEMGAWENVSGPEGTGRSIELEKIQSRMGMVGDVPNRQMLWSATNLLAGKSGLYESRTGSIVGFGAGEKLLAFEAADNQQCILTLNETSGKVLGRIRVDQGAGLAPWKAVANHTIADGIDSLWAGAALANRNGQWFGAIALTTDSMQLITCEGSEWKAASSPVAGRCASLVCGADNKLYCGFCNPTTGIYTILQLNGAGVWTTAATLQTPHDFGRMIVDSYGSLVVLLASSNQIKFVSNRFDQANGDYQGWDATFSRMASGGFNALEPSGFACAGDNGWIYLAGIQNKFPMIYRFRLSPSGAAKTTWKSGTVAGNEVTTSTHTWSNPANALTTDGLKASVSLPASQGSNNSQLLTLTNFGFTLPQSAQITGIKARVYRQAEAYRNPQNCLVDYIVQLRKAATGLTGYNQSASNINDSRRSWSTSQQAVEYGAATDDWLPGGHWTAAEINDPSFGVSLAASAIGMDNIAHIDAVAMQVFYQDGATTEVSSLRVSQRTLMERQDTAANIYCSPAHQGYVLWNSATAHENSCYLTGRSLESYILLNDGDDYATSNVLTVKLGVADPRGMSFRLSGDDIQDIKLNGVSITKETWFAWPASQDVLQVVVDPAVHGWVDNAGKKTIHAHFKQIASGRELWPMDDSIIYLKSEDLRLFNLQIADQNKTAIPDGTIETLHSGQAYDFCALFDYLPQGRGLKPNDKLVEWSVTGNIGTVNRYGRFSATRVGGGELVARYAATGAEDRLQIRVDAAGIPASIEIRPKGTTIVGPSQQLTFTALVRDKSENTLNTPVIWSLAGPGQITQNGTYTGPSKNEGSRAVVQAVVSGYPSVSDSKQINLELEDVGIANLTIRDADSEDDLPPSGTVNNASGETVEVLWTLAAPDGDLAMPIRCTAILDGRLEIGTLTRSTGTLETTWTLQWDSRHVRDGEHTLKLKTQDGFNTTNSDAAQISFVVQNNQPQGSPTGPGSGYDWLLIHQWRRQDADLGSWKKDLNQSRAALCAEATFALDALYDVDLSYISNGSNICSGQPLGAAQAYHDGIGWLVQQYQSGKIKDFSLQCMTMRTLAQAVAKQERLVGILGKVSSDYAQVNQLVQAFNAGQNPLESFRLTDGGFQQGEESLSTRFETLLALRASLEQNNETQTNSIIDSSLDYLAHNLAYDTNLQLTNAPNAGGWTDITRDKLPWVILNNATQQEQPDNLYLTAEIGRTLQELISRVGKRRLAAFDDQDALISGVILSAQDVNPETGTGGFPTGSVNVVDSSVALRYLVAERLYGAATHLQGNTWSAALSKAVTYLNLQQASEGGWNERALDTALALQALRPELELSWPDNAIDPAERVLHVIIANKGATPAVQTRVAFFDTDPARLTPKLRADLQKSISEYVSLLPNETDTLAIPLPEGAIPTSIYLMADAAEQVAEYDESNNIINRQLPQAPNLVINSHTIHAQALDGGVPIAGNAWKLMADVTNLGQLSIPYNRIRAEVYSKDPIFSENSRLLLIGTLGSSGQLNAGQTETVVFEVNPAKTEMQNPGTLPLYIWIDPESGFSGQTGDIVESDETDNLAGADIRLYAPGQLDLPDLVIPQDGISYGPLPLMQEQVNWLQFRVDNIGKSDTGEFRVQVTDDDGLNSQSIVLNALAAGKSRLVHVPLMCAKKINYALQLNADPGNEVAESLENNNATGIGLVIHAADSDLAVYDLGITRDDLKIVRDSSGTPKLTASILNLRDSIDALPSTVLDSVFSSIANGTTNNTPAPSIQPFVLGSHLRLEREGTSLPSSGEITIRYTMAGLRDTLSNEVVEYSTENNIAEHAFNLDTTNLNLASLTAAPFPLNAAGASGNSSVELRLQAANGSGESGIAIASGVHLRLWDASTGNEIAYWNNLRLEPAGGDGVMDASKILSLTVASVGLAPGKHLIKAHIDPVDHFVETDENDNLQTLLLEVPDPQAAQRHLPDLSIGAGDLQLREVGDALGVEAWVHYPQPSDDVLPLPVHHCRVSAYLETAGSRQLISSDPYIIASLAASQSEHVMLPTSLLLDSIPADASIVVVVDSDQQISEINESNNEAAISAAIPVPPTDFSASSLEGEHDLTWLHPVASPVQIEAYRIQRFRIENGVEILERQWRLDYPATSFVDTDSGLVSGKTYRYRVRSMGVNGLLSIPIDQDMVALAIPAITEVAGQAIDFHKLVSAVLVGTLPITIKGTYAGTASLLLYVNDVQVANTTAQGGQFVFSSITLLMSYNRIKVVAAQSVGQTTHYGSSSNIVIANYDNLPDLKFDLDASTNKPEIEIYSAATNQVLEDNEKLILLAGQNIYIKARVRNGRPAPSGEYSILYRTEFTDGTHAQDVILANQPLLAFNQSSLTKSPTFMLSQAKEIKDIKIWIDYAVDTNHKDIPWGKIIESSEMNNIYSIIPYANKNNTGKEYWAPSPYLFDVYDSSAPYYTIQDTPTPYTPSQVKFYRAFSSRQNSPLELWTPLSSHNNSATPVIPMSRWLDFYLPNPYASIWTAMDNTNDQSDAILDDLGMCILSERSVAINLNYPGEMTSDSSPIIPADELGNHYFIEGYPASWFPHTITILATENDTHVSIYPNHLSTLQYTGIPRSDQRIHQNPVILRKGQSYIIHSSGYDDPTGSEIVADKKVAVLINWAGNVPSANAYAADKMVEMIPPIEHLGKEYVFPILPMRNNRISTYSDTETTLTNYIIRVVATVNNTSITVENTVPLNDGTKARYRTINLDKGYWIEIGADSAYSHDQSGSAEAWLSHNVLRFIDAAPASHRIIADKPVLAYELQTSVFKEKNGHQEKRYNYLGQWNKDPGGTQGDPGLLRGLPTDMYSTDLYIPIVWPIETGTNYLTITAKSTSVQDPHLLLVDDSDHMNGPVLGSEADFATRTTGWKSLEYERTSTSGNIKWGYKACETKFEGLNSSTGKRYQCIYNPNRIPINVLVLGYNEYNTIGDIASWNIFESRVDIPSNVDLDVKTEGIRLPYTNEQYTPGQPTTLRIEVMNNGLMAVPSSGVAAGRITITQQVNGAWQPATLVGSSPTNAALPVSGGTIPAGRAHAYNYDVQWIPPVGLQALKVEIAHSLDQSPTNNTATRNFSSADVKLGDFNIKWVKVDPLPLYNGLPYVVAGQPVRITAQVESSIPEVTTAALQLTVYDSGNVHQLSNFSGVAQFAPNTVISSGNNYLARQTVSWNWIPERSDVANFRTLIDPANSVVEANELNNRYWLMRYAFSVLQGNLAVSSPAVVSPQPVDANQPFVIRVNASSDFVRAYENVPIVCFLKDPRLGPAVELARGTIGRIQSASILSTALTCQLQTEGAYQLYIGINPATAAGTTALPESTLADNWAMLPVQVTANHKPDLALRAMSDFSVPDAITRGQIVNLQALIANLGLAAVDQPYKVQVLDGAAFPQDGRVVAEGLLNTTGSLHVASQAMAQPGLIVNHSLPSHIPWQNPSFAMFNDGSATSMTRSNSSTGSTSDMLASSHYNFNLPVDASIQGIQVTCWYIERGIAPYKEVLVQLTDGTGNLVGQNKASSPSLYPTGNRTIKRIYGGPTDQWQRIWSPAEINNENFGLGLIYDLPFSGSNAAIDGIQIDVFYTADGGSIQHAGQSRTFKQIWNTQNETPGDHDLYLVIDPVQHLAATAASPAASASHRPMLSQQLATGGGITPAGWGATSLGINWKLEIYATSGITPVAMDKIGEWSPLGGFKNADQDSSGSLHVWGAASPRPLMVICSTTDTQGLPHWAGNLALNVCCTDMLDTDGSSAITRLRLVLPSNDQGQCGSRIGFWIADDGSTYFGRSYHLTSDYLMDDVNNTTHAMTLTSGEAMLDAHGTVDEKLESNNIYHRIVNIAEETHPNLCLAQIAADSTQTLIGKPIPLHAIVKNTGAGLEDSFNVAFSYKLQGQNGDYISIGRSTIAGGLEHNALGTSALVWNPGLSSGEIVVKAEVDPDHEIDEPFRNDNQATLTLVISPTTSLTLNVNAGSGYGINQVVPIVVNVLSSETSSASLRLSIMAAAGETEAGVDLTTGTPFTLGGVHEFTPTWNTGTVQAGEYYVVAELHRIVNGLEETPALMVRSNVFTVLPDKHLAAVVQTDKTAYEVGESVQLTGSIINASTNYNFPGAFYRMDILNRQGQIVYAGQSMQLIDLMRGDQRTVHLTWSDPAAWDNQLTARLTAYEEGGPTTTTYDSFVYGNAAQMTGQIDVVSTSSLHADITYTSCSAVALKLDMLGSSTLAAQTYMALSEEPIYGPGLYRKNLIPNAGLEKVEQNLPVFWAATQTSGVTTLQTTTSTAYMGWQALQFAGTAGGWFATRGGDPQHQVVDQGAPVPAATRLTASYYYLLTGAGAGMRLEAVERNAEGEVVLIHTCPRVQTETSNWRRAEFSFVTTAQTISVGLRWRLEGAQTLSGYLDNLQLEEGVAATTWVNSSGSDTPGRFVNLLANPSLTLDAGTTWSRHHAQLIADMDKLANNARPDGWQLFSAADVSITEQSDLPAELKQRGLAQAFTLNQTAEATSSSLRQAHIAVEGNSVYLASVYGRAATTATLILRATQYDSSETLLSTAEVTTATVLDTTFKRRWMTIAITSRTASLDLAFQVNGTGSIVLAAAQLEAGNDLQSWTGWVPYQPLVSAWHFDQAGREGIHRVEAQFMDSQGRLSRRPSAGSSLVEASSLGVDLLTSTGAAVAANSTPFLDGLTQTAPIASDSCNGLQAHFTMTPAAGEHRRPLLSDLVLRFCGAVPAGTTVLLEGAFKPGQWLEITSSTLELSAAGGVFELDNLGGEFSQYRVTINSPAPTIQTLVEIEPRGFIYDCGDNVVYDATAPTAHWVQPETDATTNGTQYNIQILAQDEWAAVRQVQVRGVQTVAGQTVEGPWLPCSLHGDDLFSTTMSLVQFQEGTLLLEARVDDNAGNLMELPTRALTVDRTPPVLSNPRFENLTTQNAEWVKAEDQLRLRVTVDDAGLTSQQITADLSCFGMGTMQPAQEQEGQDWVWTLTGYIAAAPDGVATVAIKAHDQAGLQAESVATQINIDHTAPQVQLDVINSPVEVPALILSGTAIDNAEGRIAQVSYALDGGGWQAIEADDGVFDAAQEFFHLMLSNLTAGTHTLLIQAVDVAGNMTNPATNKAFQVIAPPSSLVAAIENLTIGRTDLAKNGDLLRITVSVDGGIDTESLTADLSAFGGSPIAAANEVTSQSAQWLLAANFDTTHGLRSAQISGQNTWGESVSNSVSICADNEAPVVTFTPALTDIMTTNGLKIVGLACEPQFGRIALIQYRLDGQDWTTATATSLPFDDATTESFEVILASLEEGTHTLSLKAGDVTGNIPVDASTSDTFVVDTIAPQFEWVQITDLATTSSEYVKDGDNVELVAQVRSNTMDLSDQITADLTPLGGLPNTAPDEKLSENVWRWVVNDVTTSPTNGLCSIRLTVDDHAHAPVTTQSTILADNIAPYATIHVEGDNPTSSYLPKVAGTATDTVPGRIAGVQLRVDGGDWIHAGSREAIENRGFFDSAVEDYLMITTVTEGTHVIEARAIDAAGNIQLAPYAQTEVTVNRNLANPVDQASMTNDTYRYSNQMRQRIFFKDGQHLRLLALVLPSPWTVTTETLHADLSGIGLSTDTLPVSFDGFEALWDIADAQSNQFNGLVRGDVWCDIQPDKKVQYSITADHIAPTVTLNPPGHGFRSNRVYVTGFADDYVSSGSTNQILMVEGVVDGDIPTIAAPLDGSFDQAHEEFRVISDPLEDGTHTLTVVVSDLVENVTTATLQVVVDSTLPQYDQVQILDDDLPGTYSAQFIRDGHRGRVVARIADILTTIGQLRADLRGLGGSGDATPTSYDFVNAVWSVDAMQTSPTAGVVHVPLWVNVDGETTGSAIATSIADNTSPTVTLSPLSANPANTTTLIWQGIANDGTLSGIRSVFYREVGNEVWTTVTQLLDAATTQSPQRVTFQVTLNALAEGTHTLEVYACDWVGNTSTRASSSILIAMRVPNVIIDAPTSGSWMNHPVTPTWHADAPYAGIQTTLVWTSFDGLLHSTSTLQLGDQVASEGIYLFKVRAQSYHEEWGPWAQTWFGIDRTSPTVSVQGELTRSRFCESQQDLMVVLDQSGSMATANRFGIAKTWIEDMITTHLAAPLQKVGLVTFNDNAQLRVPLTEPDIFPMTTLRSLTCWGGTQIDEGLTSASAHMDNYKQTNSIPVMLLVDDGGDGDTFHMSDVEAAADAKRRCLVGQPMYIYDLHITSDSGDGWLNSPYSMMMRQLTSTFDCQVTMQAQQQSGLFKVEPYYAKHGNPVALYTDSQNRDVVWDTGNYMRLVGYGGVYRGHYVTGATELLVNKDKVPYISSTNEAIGTFRVDRDCRVIVLWPYRSSPAFPVPTWVSRDYKLWDLKDRYNYDVPHDSLHDIKDYYTATDASYSQNLVRYKAYIRDIHAVNGVGTFSLGGGAVSGQNLFYMAFVIGDPAQDGDQPDPYIRPVKASTMHEGFDFFVSQLCPPDLHYFGTAGDGTNQSGLDQVQIRLDQGSWQTVSFNSGSGTFAYDPSNLADGTHTLQARACDHAGNWSNTGSSQLALDTMPPAMQIDAPTSFTWSRTPLSATWSTTSTDLLTSLGLLIRTDTTGAITNTYIGSGTSVSAAGRYILKVSGRDQAGNVSPVAQTAFGIDLTTPSLSVGGTTQTTQASVTLSGSVQDYESGLANIQYRRTSANSWSDVSTFTYNAGTGQLDYQFTVNLELGVQTIQVRAVDACGNERLLEYAVERVSDGGGLWPFLDLFKGKRLKQDPIFEAGHESPTHDRRGNRKAWLLSASTRGCLMPSRRLHANNWASY